VLVGGWRRFGPCAGTASLGSELPRIFELAAVLRKSGFARSLVMSLLHGGVLRGSVQVAQPPLQRRAFVDRAALNSEAIRPSTKPV
jgi:hypothetical protein